MPTKSKKQHGNAKKAASANSKAVSVIKEKPVGVAEIPRRLAFGGVIPVSKSDKAGAELTAFCNQISEIYGVPSLGVNAMGGQPYLNKDGRLYLLNALRKGKRGVKSIRTEFLQMSTAPTIASICKKTIVFFDGMEVEAIGEASQASVKLDAVKLTLNMMAETRALNRAIWQSIAGDVMDRVAERIAVMGMSAEERDRVLKAGTVSAEEMDRPEPPAPKMTNDEDLIADLKAKVDSVPRDDLKLLYEFKDKLAASKSSTKVKAEVGEYIQIKLNAFDMLDTFNPPVKQ